MGKKAKETAEKPLGKMTAKELRDLAISTGEVVGAHAMNKAELIAAIKQARGIVDEKSSKKDVDVRGLKVRISQLRDKREKAVEAGNTKLVDAYRRRISNLKKKTRRTA
jgi:hypothetical protein